MRKISRAQEQFSEINFRTAADDKEKSSGFKPPASVQSAAKHALELIEKGKAGSGFTSVGRGRAHQLARGESVSLEVIKKMHSYFARHEVDKKGKDWDHDSPGKVAWLAWGGDAGRAWANSIMKKHGERTAAPWPAKPEPEEHEDHYKYIKHRDGKWVIVQKGTGKVLSHHDTREQAIASFKAMMMHKHGGAEGIEMSDLQNIYDNDFGGAEPIMNQMEHDAVCSGRSGVGVIPVGGDQNHKVWHCRTCGQLYGQVEQ